MSIIGHSHSQQDVLLHREHTLPSQSKWAGLGVRKYRLTILFAITALVLMAVTAFIVNRVVERVTEDWYIQTGESPIRNNSAVAQHVSDAKTAVLWATVGTMGGLFFILVGFVLVADVTINRSNRREMLVVEEKNRELEQASSAKSQILSAVTHDLKTPLTSIVGYIDRLLQHKETVGPLNERQEDYLQEVQSESYRLKALIDDLLDVSRIDSGSMEFAVENLEVLPNIEEALKSLRFQFNEKQIRPVLNIPSEPVLVKADPLRFTQVLTNLLSNACKYSPEGTAVTITAKEKAGLVQIDVSDSGVGISKAHQSHLFTKFFRVDNSATRQTPGTGLGLFIARHIIEAHGGTIWVESKEGEGSTFSFTMLRADVDVICRDSSVQTELGVSV